MRSEYSPESLHDWVGELEGEVDYGEFLKSKGITPPAQEHVVDDDYADDESVVDDVNVVDVVDGDDVDDDVVEGVLMVNDKRRVQDVGTVANIIEQSAPMSINRQQHAPTNSNQHAPINNRQPTIINEQQQAPINKPRPLKNIPDPIVKIKDVTIPLRVVEKPERKPKPSIARIIIEKRITSTANIVYVMAEKKTQYVSAQL